MDCPVSLRWNTRSCRSKRPRPPHADEYAAATSLILLSESGGGFCSTTASDPTITSPPKMSITNPSGLIIRIKRQKVGSPDTPLPNPIYACWMCDKVFQCSQALGGHMTHHRAKKGKAGDDHHDHIHECSHCHEAFGTGQALGGHMRKHLDRSKLATINSTSCSAAKPIIDLNRLPPQE